MNTNCNIWLIKVVMFSNYLEYLNIIMYVGFDLNFITHCEVIELISKRYTKCVALV